MIQRTSCAVMSGRKTKTEGLTMPVRILTRIGWEIEDSRNGQVEAIPNRQKRACEASLTALEDFYLTVFSALAYFLARKVLVSLLSVKQQIFTF
jgi:hypothetical protein